jgi:hypothetical protein
MVPKSHDTIPLSDSVTVEVFFYRFHSLMRDYVDEEDYPPSQEYFLYADSQVDYTNRRRECTV